MSDALIAECERKKYEAYQHGFRDGYLDHLCVNGYGPGDESVEYRRGYEAGDRERRARLANKRTTQ